MRFYAMCQGSYRQWNPRSYWGRRVVGQKLPKRTRPEGRLITTMTFRRLYVYLQFGAALTVLMTNSMSDGCGWPGMKDFSIMMFSSLHRSRRQPTSESTMRDVTMHSDASRNFEPSSAYLMTSASAGRGSCGFPAILERRLPLF